MALVKRFHKIDAMLVCIGDHFTMGPPRAAEAVKLVAPRTVIPMHYGTFPVLTGTPEVFERELKMRKLKSKLWVMKIGDTICAPRVTILIAKRSDYTHTAKSKEVEWREQCQFGKGDKLG